jgi:hypothetical protein
MSSQTLTRAAHTRRGGAVYSIASMNSTCHMVFYICLQLYTFYNAQLHPSRHLIRTIILFLLLSSAT